MKQLYKIDSGGFYNGPVFVEDDASLTDCTEVRPIDGLFKAEFIDGQWVEGLSQSEIDGIKNQIIPKTELEIMKKQQELMQQAIDDLIFGGGF